MENTVTHISETNYRKFQELLRKGMGSRNQTEFAKVSGISRGNLNRMLNGADIARPSVGVLKKIASCMHSVTLDELLVSCGYEPLDITSAIKKNMFLIKDGLSNCYIAAKLSSVSDVIDFLNTLYIEDESKFFITKSETNKTKYIPAAEDYTIIEQHWTVGKYKCITYFAVFYVTTTNGQLIVLGNVTDYYKMTELEIITPKMEEVFKKETFDRDSLTYYEEIPEITEEEKKTSKFLKHILSTDGTYTETINGCGFYYEKTPKEFFEFLMDNASYFCVTRENSDLYRQATQTDKDIDEIFSEFTYYDEQGTGAAIAFILNRKTGQDFMYYSKDGRCDESKGCIICPFTNNKEDYVRIPSTLLQETFFTARALGIAEFGMVYYTYVVDKHNDQVYKTEDFFYEFK